MKSIQGSVFLEAVSSLALLFFPSLIMTVELGRATQVQAMLHHLAFHYVRHRTFGASERDSKQVAFAQAVRGLSEKEQRRWHRVVDFWSEKREGKEIWSRVRIRYSGLWSWMHSRFQMTKTCSFSI